MVICNESSPSDAAGVASRPLTRAGLRKPPRGVEPTAVFVVIEMAVLFCVSALAMVSIIVSIDDGVTGTSTQQSRQDDRSPSAPAGHGAATPPGKTAVPDTVSKTAQVAR